MIKINFSWFNILNEFNTYCHCMLNFFMIQAFRLAPASTVAPFEYSAVLWAVLLGLLIWGDIPSWSVIGGASVLVASGIFHMQRESMARGKD